MAEADRDLHERIRLALWRMDSAANALVFAESARPPNQFKAFHATDQAYTNTFQLVKKGQILAPSPLMSSVPDYAKLYFQIDGEGNLSSPQVPQGNSRDLAEQNYMSREAVEEAEALLEANAKVEHRQHVEQQVEQTCMQPVACDHAPPLVLDEDGVVVLGTQLVHDLVGRS